jgi:Ca2+-binding RTX toxin-like protein
LNLKFNVYLNFLIGLLIFFLILDDLGSFIFWTSLTVAYNSATNTLTLNGADTIANYEQVLKSVKYNNTKVNPNLTPRQIEFVVNDGASFNNFSPTAITTIAFSKNLSGTSGNDTLIGAEGNDTLNGLAGNDRLEGKAGNESLDGGIGNDTMLGDIGNDTYIVDSTTDLITDTSTTVGEIDKVNASISYVLGANLENLTLTGTNTINGTGNALNNYILGNTAANALNGSIGNDTMVGSTGNDLYVVDSSTDVISETTTTLAEIDKVNASISYVLGTNLENLTLTGTNTINGTGNALNNYILGNTAANALNGSIGNDTLTGGTGSDRFLYDTNAVFVSSAVGKDIITDFTVGTDKIVLDKTTFTALTSATGNGFNLAIDFAVVANDSLVAASSGLIVYSTATDNLFYNQNGNAVGLGTGEQFATLSGIATLNANDFIIQA